MNPEDLSETPPQEIMLANNNQMKIEIEIEGNPCEDDNFGEDLLKDVASAKCFTYRTLETQTKLMTLNVYKYMKEYRIAHALATGNDMNVNVEVAKATSVSVCGVKDLIRDYRYEGIERAIGPHVKKIFRQRESDIIVKVGDSPVAKIRKKK